MCTSLLPWLKVRRTRKLTELIWPGYARCPEQYAPDRIIIESSGSAFPATLAWQVRQLEEEGLLLDAVVSASSRSSAPCSCALICTFALATLFHDADCNACSGCLAPPQL